MKVGYVRVSSEGERQSTSMQKEALLKAGVDERHIYEDKVSALSPHRPGLEKALAFLRAGDELVTWKLDRLARDLSHLITLANQLKEREVGLISLTEKIDTTTPHGQLFFHMFGALAQFELALTRERIMEGLAAAKKRGSQFGRPRIVSQEKLELILSALEQGKTKAWICRNLDIKHATLYSALQRHKNSLLSCEGDKDLLSLETLTLQEDFHE